MAWNTTKKQDAPKENKRPTVSGWLLFVFGQNEIKDANSGEIKYIRFNCKMSSKPAEGEKYGAGMLLSVMAAVSGDRQTKIDPADYTHKWIMVDGGIQLEDRKDRNGSTFTNITVWADSVKLAPPKN